MRNLILLSCWVQWEERDPTLVQTKMHNYWMNCNYIHSYHIKLLCLTIHFEFPLIHRESLSCIMNGIMYYAVGHRWLWPQLDWLDHGMTYCSFRHRCCMVVAVVTDVLCFYDYGCDTLVYKGCDTNYMQGLCMWLCWLSVAKILHSQTPALYR